KPDGGSCMMDFKNSAMKLFSNEEPIDIYTGPYVVRPGELDILVRTPHTYEDAVSYADKLIEGCAVMVNFTEVDKETRNRIFDYMCGVSYIVNASISKVSDTIMMYAPARVEVEKQVARKTSWLGR
ncbi:MAG: cell division protein SepF, partial [Succiniclasticum sp.]|nr:cell division protein SepF [Succiniclasticum sp.]